MLVFLHLLKEDIEGYKNSNDYMGCYFNELLIGDEWHCPRDTSCNDCKVGAKRRFVRRMN